MPGQSVPEAMLEMLLAGAIKPNDAKKYLKNYRYFESKRPQIRASYSGKWVAALNGQIFSANTRIALLQVISAEPDSDRAYLEEILE